MYTCDICGWLDSVMKVNFHIVALIWYSYKALAFACMRKTFIGLSWIKCYWKLTSTH